jgi:hypothetical protein
MPYKNISPDLWGPHLWKFMHLFTLSYPNEPTEEEKDTAFNFFTAIQKVLPCEKCRYNFKNHLETLTEEVLDSNENLVKWLFNIHNEVNKTTGKPIFSFDDFINIYINNNNTASLNITNIDKKEKKEDNIDNINDNMKELIKQEFKKELKEEIMNEIELKKINNVEVKDKKNDGIINKLKNNVYIWVILLLLILIIIIYLNKKY